MTANRTTGDESASNGSGATDPAANHPNGASRVGSRPSAIDADRSLAVADQAAAGGYQALAGADTTSSESDQTSADRDQLASDRDQDASDHDLAHGLDAGAHDRSRAMRLLGTQERSQTARARLESANRRDGTAHDRDLVALARDQAAAARDLLLAAHDSGDEILDSDRAVSGSAIVVRAARQRERAAEQRARAAQQRELAAIDREAARHDRVRAAAERLEARADREALARQVARSETDPLTGARLRAAGLAELDRELERCRRTGAPLVVAYVDVIGRKALDDAAGHSAGDALLKATIRTISARVRSYDLVVRLGGDEFLYAMSNVTLAATRERFSDIGVALGTTRDAGAIRTGFAELRPDDGATQLIARADGELTARRYG